MIKVSVIMATFNGSRFLSDQLDSIYGQTYNPLQLFVSDDGSSDHTFELLQKEQEKGRLTLCEDHSHLGVVGNFKRAASLAGSEDYIAFADQDDVWTLNKLEQSVSLIQTIEKAEFPALVYADPKVINQEGEVIGQSLWQILGYHNYHHALPTILFGNPVGGCTMLINPVLAREVRNIPDNCLMHDAWLALYAFTFGKTAIVEMTTLFYRQHQQNVTFSTNYTRESRFKRVLKEVRNWLMGGDELFKDQFVFVDQFYRFYKHQMDTQIKATFERFLALQNASYLRKKIAFRRAMRQAAEISQVS